MSDSTFSALASAAGVTLVQAMTTDAWGALRDGAARILSAGSAERRRQLHSQLEISSTEVRDNRVSNIAASSRWQGRVEAALEAHPEIAPELSELIRKFRDQHPGTRSNIQQVIAGNLATINQAGRDNNIDNSRKKTSYGGPLAVFAVLAVVAILGGGIWAAKTAIVWVNTQVQGTKITKDTPCGQYLEASTEDREHAVKTIGVALGATGAGNPMARLNVDYSCGSRPSTPVGKIIAVQNY